MPGSLTKMSLTARAKSVRLALPSSTCCAVTGGAAGGVTPAGSGQSSCACADAGRTGKQRPASTSRPVRTITALHGRDAARRARRYGRVAHGVEWHGSARRHEGIISFFSVFLARIVSAVVQRTNRPRRKSDTHPRPHRPAYCRLPPQTSGRLRLAGRRSHLPHCSE